MLHGQDVRQLRQYTDVHTVMAMRRRNRLAMLGSEVDPLLRGARSRPAARLPLLAALCWHLLLLLL